MEPLIREGAGIMLGEEKVKLSSLVNEKNGSDLLAQILAGLNKKGLPKMKDLPAGQGGLVNCLDEWLDGQQNKSVEFVRANADNIVEFASKYC
jgi:hypothetical protein